mgnify:FL=1
MIRKNLLFFTLILIAILNGCHTKTKQADQIATPSVLETTWTGKESDGECITYHFLPDGILHYEIESGSWKNASWKQDGNKIYFEMNAKF